MAVMYVTGDTPTRGERGVLSQVSHCQADVCREYEGNGRSVVGVFGDPTHTHLRHVYIPSSLFGSSTACAAAPRVRREPAELKRPFPRKKKKKLGRQTNTGPVTVNLLFDHRVGQVCKLCKDVQSMTFEVELRRRGIFQFFVILFCAVVHLKW